MPKISEEQKELRKQQVLLAAMEVFKRKGYEKATLKDIVEEAGMSRGWIYLYYSDKNQIFMDLLLYLDNQQETQFTNSHSKNVLEFLRNYFQDIKNAVSDNESNIYPAIYEFWITGWREETVREFFLKRYERVVNSFTNLFLQGVEAGTISPVKPLEEIVKSMMSSMDGILVHSLAFGADHIDIEKQIDHLLSRIEKLIVLPTN